MMNKILRILFCFVFLGVLPAYAAEPYPSKVVTIVVPFTAGGPTDTVARLMSRAMGAALKTQIIALLIGPRPLKETLAKLERLFRGNPVKVRKNRRSARRPISMHRSYHFQRKVKKTVF